MKVPLLAAAAMYGVTGFLFQAETDKLNDPDPGECSSSGNVKMISWSKAKLPGGLDGRRMQNISKYFNPSGKSLYMQVPPPPGLPEEVYKQAIVKPKKKSLSAHSIAHSILEHKRRKQKEEEDMRQRVTEIQTQAREKAVAEELAHRRAQSRNDDDDDDDDDNDPKMANIPKSVEQHQFLPLILPSWLWRYTTGTGAFTNVPMGWKTMSKFDLLKSENPFQIEMVLDDDEETLGGGRSIVIDLGAPHKINVIKIDWAVCACRRLGAVQLQVSNDGIRWKAVQKPLVGAWGSHNVRYYEVENVFTYFRIMPTVASPVQWVGVWDIQMFGETALRFPNAYGWYHSYQSGDRFYGGTEINFLIPMGNVLYACFGNWMNTRTWRPAEVLRLRCGFCDWDYEHATEFAGRVESLKVAKWTVAGTAGQLTRDITDLYISFYLNWLGEGRCVMEMQTRIMQWSQEYYFSSIPFVAGDAFSARAKIIFRDPRMVRDYMFVTTGIYGIKRGAFCESCDTHIYWGNKERTESGDIPTRPLALTVLDDGIFFSSLSWVRKRRNGLWVRWVEVFDMANLDSSEVEPAVGGIRGLGTITNVHTPKGQALMFGWVANAHSAGCMYRLDPCEDDESSPIFNPCTNKTQSTEYNYEMEGCVRDMFTEYLGLRYDDKPALVRFLIANYNYPTEFIKPNGDYSQIIGFEALVIHYSTEDYPMDPKQIEVSADGFTLAYHSAGGYVVRHNSTYYEVRQPWSTHLDPDLTMPCTTSIRTIAVSPFGDGAFYMGGYDPNFYPVRDTAWAMRAEAYAVWEEPTPCLGEYGCPHTVGRPWSVKGCGLCRSWGYSPDATAFWYGFEGFGTGPYPMRCQGLMKYLNSAEGSDYCDLAKDWAVTGNCCAHRGCDLCKRMKGASFNPFGLAGDIDGEEYTCLEAQDFIFDSDMDCDVATAMWEYPCCKQR